MGAMTPVVDMRPMLPDDAVACEEVWRAAFTSMRRAYHLPAHSDDDAARERFRRRIQLMCGTDPGGSWVATDNDVITGFAQAVKRERLWVLSLLAVAVDHQGRGVARRLMERALAYGGGDGPGLIMSSRDPRAMHRYVQAGFALHPAMAAFGSLRRDRLFPTPHVRVGGTDDLDLVADVDRHVRGSAHGPELQWMLDMGCHLLVVPGRGYALTRATGIALLAAVDEDTAAALFVAGLAATPEGAVVDVNWMTASQQWAIRLCTHLGLELMPVGAVMVRERPGPLVPYLPSGAYG